MQRFSRLTTPLRLSAGLAPRKFTASRMMAPIAFFSTEAASGSGATEKGTVKWFDSTKGYGFIVRESGETIFVHATAISGDGPKVLSTGQKVSFGIGKSNKKGPLAADVKVEAEADVVDEPRDDTPGVIAAPSS